MFGSGLLIVRRFLATPFLLTASAAIVVGTFLADEEFLDDFAKWFFDEE